MPVCGFIYTACSTSRPVAMRVERPGPSVVIVDGQSVKTTERGGTRGFDAYKRVKGRKRHILVDTLGLLLANRVEPADTSDRRASALLLGLAAIRLMLNRIAPGCLDETFQTSSQSEQKHSVQRLQSTQELPLLFQRFS